MVAVRRLGQHIHIHRPLCFSARPYFTDIARAVSGYAALSVAEGYAYVRCGAAAAHIFYCHGYSRALARRQLTAGDGNARDYQLRRLGGCLLCRKGLTGEEQQAKHGENCKYSFHLLKLPYILNYAVFHQPADLGIQIDAANGKQNRAEYCRLPQLRRAEMLRYFAESG